MNCLHIVISEFNDGGFLMYVIFCVTVIIWMTGLEKSFFYWKFSSARNKFIKYADSLCNGDTHFKNSTGLENYDYFLLQLRKNISQNSNCHKNLIREFIICSRPMLDRHLKSMSVWISIAPLLGLLGTVIGMVETFKTIMDFGAGNPGITAKGISIALLTTQAGLTSAFPALIFYNFLVNKKKSLLNQIIIDCEILFKRLNDSHFRYRKDQDV